MVMTSYTKIATDAFDSCTMFYSGTVHKVWLFWVAMSQKHVQKRSRTFVPELYIGMAIMMDCQQCSSLCLISDNYCDTSCDALLYNDAEVQPCAVCI